MKKRKKNGQSLLEVLVALTIAILVVLALVRAVTVAVRNASFARNQALATKYSEEAMEWLRSQRDKSWDNLDSKDDPAGNRYCLNSLSWPASVGSCSSTNFIPGTPFQREVVLTEVTAGEKIKAEVKVSWQETRKTYQSRLYSYFTKW